MDGEGGKIRFTIGGELAYEWILEGENIKRFNAAMRTGEIEVNWFNQRF